MHKDDAAQCLKALLAELPAEFSMSPPDPKGEGRESFQVIKKRNVRSVHGALWELQIYFGLQDEAEA
jgi:hypothetical protein